MAKRGLYSSIQAKRKRIAAAFKAAAKTTKKPKK